MGIRNFFSHRYWIVHKNKTLSVRRSRFKPWKAIDGPFRDETAAYRSFRCWMLFHGALKRIAEMCQEAVEFNEAE